MNPEIQEIEVSLENLKAKIQAKKDLESLEKNAAFKRLILKGFFETKAIACARMTAQASLHEQQTKILQNTLMAISGTQGYLAGVWSEGTQAEEDLEAYNQELDAANAEG